MVRGIDSKFFVSAMRCLVVSTNALFGRCLADGLGCLDTVSLAEFTCDLDMVPDLIEQTGATIALVDLGDDTIRDSVALLRKRLPDLCIMGLSVDETAAEDVLASARLGCTGIVPRDATLDDVVRISLSAEQGEVAVLPSVAASMMRALAEPDTALVPANDPTECLTQREREICQLVCNGLTNKEIAREVNRSVGTVKNHVRSILTKFDVPRRTALAAHLRG